MNIFFQKIFYFLAIGGGTGLFFIPGTTGTFVASFIWLFFIFIFSLDIKKQLLIILVIFILGIYICNLASIYLKKYDHKSIVWDEFTGIFLIITMLPELNWQWFILGFFLFRFFDVLKPFPIYYFHKNMKGGLGIMFDDLLAGIFTIIILYILNFLLK